MNSVHASRFPKFHVLISAKRSEKAWGCTLMLPIQKRFYGSSQHTHNFPAKNRPNIGTLYTRMARRYYSSNTGKPERSRTDFVWCTKKLENAGYRAKEKKFKFLQNKMERLGHEIDENGIKPNKEKLQPYWTWDIRKTRKKTNIVPRGKTILGKIPTKIFSENQLLIAVDRFGNWPTVKFAKRPIQKK